MFNHKTVVLEIDFTVGSKEMSCDCSNSPYVYGPTGHLTGNLRIVDDRQIRQLLIKGPSYREQNNINWNKIKSILLDSIRAYKVQWAKREHFDVRMLNEWHSKINECIKNRINVLKRKKPIHRKLQVLKNRAHLVYLEQFHQRYVLVLADKASNNIITLGAHAQRGYCLLLSISLLECQFVSQRILPS